MLATLNQVMEPVPASAVVVRSSEMSMDVLPLEIIRDIFEALMGRSFAHGVGPSQWRAALPLLQSSHLFRRAFLDQVTRVVLPSGDTPEVLSQCPNLRHLRFDATRRRRLKSNNVELLSEQLPNVSQVSVLRGKFLSNAAVGSLSQLRTLQDVSIAEIRRHQWLAWAELLRANPVKVLRVVHWRGPSPQLNDLMHDFQTTQIEVFSCGVLFNCSAGWEGVGPMFWKCFPQLKVLRLSLGKDMWNCRSVEVLAGLRHLEHLEIGLLHGAVFDDPSGTAELMSSLILACEKLKTIVFSFQFRRESDLAQRLADALNRAHGSPNKCPPFIVLQPMASVLGPLPEFHDTIKFGPWPEKWIAARKEGHLRLKTIRKGAAAALSGPP
mmetsp:Transcript_5968/g.14500  ORF Transcript_5968/g.14500 Transcript_5968/m.14500 type:complete len:381 (-) Transcript_5968:517-1659(-)